MAVIQPEEVAGLSELFDEVRALRRELELMKAGVRLDPQIAERPIEASPVANLKDGPEPESMAPEDIRERVGRVIGGERSGTEA